MAAVNVEQIVTYIAVLTIPAVITSVLNLTGRLDAIPARLHDNTSGKYGSPGNAITLFQNDDVECCISPYLCPVEDNSAERQSDF
jgi:hypothetical protein